MCVFMVPAIGEDDQHCEGDDYADYDWGQSLPPRTGYGATISRLRSRSSLARP